jgi:F0F1-type ATP synthase delta subunit
LTAEEQQKVKESILTQLGGQQATVTFRIDPSIMGGLVVKVGDKVLDGSVSGQLETLRQNLR